LLIGIWILVAIRQSPTVVLTRGIMARVGVSRYAATDSLRRLEAAGIARVLSRPGKSPVVSLLEPGSDDVLNINPA
jgi:DNA-binding GntR family transcriptional regulator